MGDLRVRDIQPHAYERRQTTETKQPNRQSACGGDLPKKPAASALVNPGERESIVAQICIHGATVQQVSQRMGMPRHVIETVLIQQLANKAAAEYRRGFEDGRQAQVPLRPNFSRRAS